MATELSELPLSANVGLYDIFPEGPDALRMEDYYYPEDEPHPDDVTINSSPANGTSIDYVAWEAERAANTYAGVYIDDTAKAEFLKILFPQQFPRQEASKGRGYTQLLGMLKAHDAGLRTFSPEQLERVEDKVNSQWNSINEILAPFLDAENMPEDRQSRALKIEAMIEDARKKLLEMKNKARRAEINRLLAHAALKNAA